jgi:ATP-dependent DNA ligase
MIERLSPMLAAQAEPFDSDEHLFEVKWNGVRTLVAVEAGHWRAWGRELSDYASRYPELEMLRGLPDGALLDGELVVLRDGRAELDELMRRHHLVSLRKIQEASRFLPATYIVFDLLYAGGHGVRALRPAGKASGHQAILRRSGLADWFDNQLRRK